MQALPKLGHLAACFQCMHGVHDSYLCTGPSHPGTCLLSGVNWVQIMPALMQFSQMQSPFVLLYCGRCVLSYAMLHVLFSGLLNFKHIVTA